MWWRWWGRVRDGREYERWVARGLRKKGWVVQCRGRSGDQGIDLVARRLGVTVGVQCKWRENGGSVDNSAVQEAYTGMSVVGEGIEVTCVITNGWFTRGARRAADATGVVLMKDDDMGALWLAVRGRRVAGWKLRAAVVGVGAVAVVGVVNASSKIGPEPRFHPQARIKEVPITDGPRLLPPPPVMGVEIPVGGLVMRCVSEVEKRRVRHVRSAFVRCMSGRRS